MANLAVSTSFLPSSAIPSSPSSFGSKRRHNFCIRAQASPINPSIRKDEPKVVDTVLLSEIDKPVNAYCRCWKSGTFPLCDGTHAKHNKETGDNVGPLLLKK